MDQQNDTIQAEERAVFAEPVRLEDNRAGRHRLNERIRERLRDKRAVYLLPNMITMTSMFLGFLSMIWSVQGRFKVARLTHSASEFGVQFDSLADLVAFGFAPAMLVWEWSLQSFGRAGVAAAFIYAACGALRLARFNVSAHTASKRFFVGLPIPAGACTMVCFVLFAGAMPDGGQGAIRWLCFVLTVITGFLMVSRVRYFSFKEYDIFRAHPYRVLVSFLVLLALLYSSPRLMGFAYCAAYIASGLVYTFCMLPKSGQQPAEPNKGA